MIPYKFNPLGISRYSKEFYTYLTFTALEANSKVKLTVVGSPNVSALQYKKNNGSWTNYVIDTDIQLEEIGDYVQFRNNYESFSINDSNYAKFVMTGKISGSGNIQSLLKFSTQASNYCFDRLFQGCTSLVTAPELPALIVGNYSYFYMFNACINLINAPNLPATSIGSLSYANMFYGCSNLITAPSILPAMNVPQQAYQAMFQGCTLLKDSPKLPASNLATSCYAYMFKDCTSLSGISELSATILANSCYREMFENCTSLKEAPVLPATTLGAACYYGMFTGCSSLKDMPVISANLVAGTSNFGYMFATCTSLTGTVDLLPTYLIGANYGSMFINCTSLETAPHIHLSGIQVPQANMFYNCPNLKEIDVDSVIWDNTNTQNWLYNNQTSGTFYCPSELIIPSRDVNGVPSSWNIVPKDVILGKIIEENGVKKFAELSFDGTSGTVIRSETFENVYSYNKISNLPYKKRLNYIESTGTQYINTGVKPDFANGDSIEIKFYKSEGGGNICFLGSRQTPGAVNGLYVLGTAIVFCDDSTFTSIPFVNTGVFTLTIDDNYVKINDNQNTMPLRVSSAYDMFLFALNNGGSPFGYAQSMKLYDWKYYDNGVLAQHLIPVLDNNNVPCMYDTVSESFIYNAGTGTFNYGNIESEDIIELGQIIDDNGTQKFASLEFNGTTPTLKEIKTYTNVYEYNK